MREGLCFSCSEQTDFQLFGQSGTYLSYNHAVKYFEQYQQELGAIECMMCGNKVSYRKDERDVWQEIVEEVITWKFT
jgi:hypothetical protein